MKARILCLVLVVLSAPFSGCGVGNVESNSSLSNNRGKIEGTSWVSRKTEIDGKTIPAGTVRLNFSPSTFLVCEWDGDKFRGKYILGPGDTVIWKFDEPLNGSTEHSYQCMFDGNQLTLKDQKGTEIIFDRVK